MGEPGDDLPPWEVHWWDDIVEWIAGHPEFADQLPALERWRARLEADPADVPAYLLLGDELGVRVSRPPETDLVIAWQTIDWSLNPNAPNRRIVYIRRVRGLDEPDGLPGFPAT